ncbi:hypothetical protein [Lacipirellula parvula]|uniref:Uncharacterized protein n=1 Tax=Lacipirellula parvula TaxID=2650471 RepID=A0A5K7X9N3_9BACT|nr:hypothetical protein [Lacipirellula parvula]BBO33248.1 hypothetical protein PLANPX_2860 [Lacipirellula parvula]
MGVSNISHDELSEACGDPEHGEECVSQFESKATAQLRDDANAHPNLEVPFRAPLLPE